MTTFIQLHLLTSYPPANLNRDDLGRPKTAVMGGALRLRISSQSLKRAWRKSEVFENAVGDHVGVRTKEMGVRVRNELLERDVPEKLAQEAATQIAKRFGKLKKGSVEIEQLAHFSPEEQANISALVDRIVETGKPPEDDELELLTRETSATDIAMFGRMLADSPSFNVEAAAQVAHALSVHRVAIEDDFFTAVDDLNTRQEHLGAGHMGETEFAAGLFYQYICINRDLLVSNLGGDVELANRAVDGLIQAAATVSPTGKQNSFGSRARASYVLCEKGDQQPRSLSVAFLSPVQGDEMLSRTIRCLTEMVSKMDTAYGACATGRAEMNIETGEGSLAEIVAFATE